MAKPAKIAPGPAEVLRKCPTGTKDLNEIIVGGLPQCSVTLICGGIACGGIRCGKALLSHGFFHMEFLVSDALWHYAAGVFISFEEKFWELARATSLRLVTSRRPGGSQETDSGSAFISSAARSGRVVNITWKDSSFALASPPTPPARNKWCSTSLEASFSELLRRSDPEGRIQTPVPFFEK